MYVSFFLILETKEAVHTKCAQPFLRNALSFGAHRLFSLLLLLIDPFPHLNNHLLQQHRAFFLRLCVDRMHFSLALGVGGRVATFIEVVVQLVDSTGAGLADFAFVLAYIKTAFYLSKDALRILQSVFFYYPASVKT